MSKIKKTQISATIDIGVYNWLLRQDGKLSSNINRILKEHITATDAAPISKKPLALLMGEEKELYIEDHMARINAELDRMERER